MQQVVLALSRVRTPSNHRRSVRSQDSVEMGTYEVVPEQERQSAAIAIAEFGDDHDHRHRRVSRGDQS